MLSSCIIRLLIVSCIRKTQFIPKLGGFYKNWEMDNMGKSREKICDEKLEKEKDRMVGNSNFTIRSRDTYPVMNGVCQSEFIKNVKLEEVGKLI